MFSQLSDRAAKIERYLKILGLKHGASATEVKAAFRKKVKKTHPDRNHEDTANDAFTELKTAFDYLLQHGTTRVCPNNRKRCRAAPQQHTAYYNLTVSLQQLYRGCSRKLSIRSEQFCKSCGGQCGKKLLKILNCSNCNSTGYVTVSEVPKDGIRINLKRQCPVCDGRGGKSYIQPSCIACNATGKVSSVQVVTVSVPAGSRWGETIVVQGVGSYGSDLIITLRRSDSEQTAFERCGDDLLLKKEISIWEALTGYRFMLEHLDGRTYCIGCTMCSYIIIQHGQQRVVKKLGMPKRDGTFGDLVIEFRISYASGKLNNTQLQAIRAVLEKQGLIESLPKPNSSVQNVEMFIKP